MDGKLELNPRERPRKWFLKRLTASIFAIVCATLYALDRRVVISIVSKHTTSVTPTQYKKCQPPLPTLLAARPPTPDSPRFKTAIASLDSFLATRAAASDIDSLSVSVVTPVGPLFERGYGLLKANDTTSTETVTRDSAYRIASISKMFTVFETLILRDMGMLNWDDPVAKFLPNFTHPKEGWSSYLQGEYSADKSPITLRQLATHMSGLGRDYPPENFGDVWPLPLDEVERDDGKAGRTGTAEALLEAAMHYPLVAPQYTFPVYSNTGFDLLGLCNVAAFEMVTGRVNVTHHELLDEHIFQPLGLTSSFYRIANASVATRVAIPSSDFEWADMTYSPAYEPSGGQFSSLADLGIVLRSFLSPDGEGILSPYVMREWLRPLHAWSDGFQEVGAPWEIAKLPGTEERAYAKGGNLPGYHSQFVVVPQWSYGVVVLVTGEYADTTSLARTIMELFQPAFDALLLTEVTAAYTGIWVGDGSVAIVLLKDGVLYLESLIVRGKDVLEILQRAKPGESRPVALWSAGRPDEFRLALGRQYLNDNADAGCEPYWVSLDPPMANGAPVDVIFWEGSELVYPSAKVRLERIG